MRITGFPKSGLILAAAIVAAISVTGAFAQDNSAPAPTPQFHDITPPDNSASQTAPPAQPAPPPVDTTTIATPAPMTPGDSTGLSPAAQQVVQLEQAKVSDSTIITFVQNSGSLYGLTASQIVYLKQQGVSDGVINAMLNQRTVLAASTQPAPPDNSAMAPPVATVEQPTTPAPSSVYVVPDTQTYYYDDWAYPYYYPYYGYYGWPVYWGWGGGWGYRGGYYHGGGFHGPVGGGGFHGGFGGGGFHGGGGGFHGGGGGGHR